MFGSYEIRPSFKVEPNLVLAPMSGVTTSSFRRLIKRLNPGAIGLMLTEFISVEGMTRGGKRTLGMMRFAPEERPLGIQIFGYDIERMCDAAKMVEDSGADLLDINCGCPAPKVVRRGGGCELMRQPQHLSQMLKAVRSSVKLPFTIKFRAGWDENSKNAVEIAKIAESEGVEGLAVHARTRAQLYRGSADWELVREVADSVKIPVCGSGDVLDISSAKERLQGKVAGLFIGRGAINNPFIFGELTGMHSLRKRDDLKVALGVTELYLELLQEEFPPPAVVGKIKQLVSQMGRKQPWRRAVLVSLTLPQILDVLKQAHEDLEKPIESAQSIDRHAAPNDIFA